MGWTGGSDILDTVVKFLLTTDLSNSQKKKCIKALIQVLYDHDWDTENESKYFNHPLVNKIFRELNPDVDYDE